MSTTSAKASGSVISGIGALVQGSNTADTLDENAQIQEQNARAAIISSKLNADKQSLTAGKVMGAARAGYGASGVSGDSGSVLAVMSASAANAETDRQNILYGGQVRATNYENQASLDRTSANNAMDAGYINAVGSMVALAAL